MSLSALNGSGIRLRLVGVMLGMFVGLLALAPSALASASVTFGSPQLVGGGIGLQSIACETAGSCFAVGYSGVADNGSTDINSYVIPITDGVSGMPVAVPAVAMPIPGLATPGFRLELTDLVCVSSSTCYAVGSYYAGDSTLLEYGGGVVVTITNGVPSSPELIQSSTPAGWGNFTQLALTGISCWSTSGCEAVGTLTGVDSPAGELTDYGVAASILDGVPQSVVTDRGVFDFSSVECFASSACEILGNDGGGVLVGLNGGAFANPQAPASLNYNSWTFACSSATSCLIVPTYNGDLYQTLTNNTTIGPAITSTFAVAGHSGSCPTTTVCWMVGGTPQMQTVVEPIVSGVPQLTTAGNVGQLLGVACMSPMSCLAITSSAIVPFTASFSNASSTGSGSSPSAGPSNGSSPSAGASSNSNVSPQLAVAKITQKDGAARVSIECEDAKCRLELIETIRLKHRKTMKLTTVYHKALTLRANTRVVESLKLNALGVKALEKAKRLTATLTIRLSGRTMSVHTLRLNVGKNA